MGSLLNVEVLDGLIVLRIAEEIRARKVEDPDGLGDLQRAGGHWKSHRRWRSTAGPFRGHEDLVQGTRQ
ncbi:hypothetical protein HPB47_003169, partial [Ixodes persulcatus]